MHRVASSTVAILIKPNPLERSDCLKKVSCAKVKVMTSQADPLIINDCHFFNSAKLAEFLVQVTFLSTDAKAKDP